MARAVDKAYQTVRERIVRGVYPASSRITEQEVAAAAGVSRTPVREALRSCTRKDCSSSSRIRGRSSPSGPARTAMTCLSCGHCSNRTAPLVPRDA